MQKFRRRRIFFFDYCIFLDYCTLLFSLLHILCAVVKIKVCSSTKYVQLSNKIGSPAWTFSFQKRLSGVDFFKNHFNYCTNYTRLYCTSSQLHNLYLTIAHFTTAQITSNSCTFLADNCTICVLLHAIANPGRELFETFKEVQEKL